MKNLIIKLSLVLIVVASCRVQKPENKSAMFFENSITETETVDSIYKSVVPADSSIIKLLIECNERGQALVRQVESYRGGNRIGLPEIIIDGNRLTAKCKSDSLAIYNVFKKRFKKEIEYRDRRVEVTKYTNILTRPQRTMIAGFWVVSAMLVLIAVIYVKRLFKH